MKTVWISGVFSWCNVWFSVVIWRMTAMFKTSVSGCCTVIDYLPSTGETMTGGRLSAVPSRNTDVAHSDVTN